MGEEKAASLVVPIAKRVQRNHPDSEPIGVLVAATATLYLAGYTDPKDRHVLHAAERMRERLADPDQPAEEFAEARQLTEAEIAEVERLTPRWFRARELLRLDMAEKHSESTYRIWIEKVVLCGREDKTILLGAPQGILTWVERRYTGYILSGLHAAEMPAEGIRWVKWLPANLPEHLAPPTGVGEDADQREHDQGGTHDQHPD